MAVCVAVIGKENFALFTKTVPSENSLRFYYIAHTSVDVIEEKVSAAAARGGMATDVRELYLGLLYPTEEYKAYGYVTNTRVKFVIMVDTNNTGLRDNEMRQMFRKLHQAYANLVCNPFYEPGCRIKSPAFERVVDSLIQN